MIAARETTNEPSGALQTVNAEPDPVTIDPNGNTTQKVEGADTWAYTWSAENQLTRVVKNGAEVARFAYDPLGRRVEKVAGGATTTFAYDGEDILRESRSDGGVFKYIHGPGIDEPLAKEGTAGALTYLHADGLGSIVKTTNASGAVTSTLKYNAFGVLETGSPSPFGFTAREFDAETGLAYYRARYYSPREGRFLSEDPIGFAAGVNFYNYVLANPVNLLDPFGLDATTSDPTMQRCMCELWRDSGFGFQPYERAAWAINKDGTYSCLRWPWSAAAAQEQWVGQPPDDLAGLFHTHPSSKDPKPSTCGARCDNGAASKTNRPVYSISRKGVFKITPDGTITQEEGSDWYKGFNLKTCECK